MLSMFPIGLPWPTVMYLVLYIVTLIIHVVFMNYVLAGSWYLVSISLFERRTADQLPSLVAGTLREWLPFMLSAAITAGIAPLLFVQILYKRNFYTANLLLFHRWMAILPVLIVAFYLLYIWKAKRVQAWPRLITFPLGLLTFSGFAFIAWSWTENHLLSINPGAWAEHYADGDMMYRSREVLPRLAVWFAGSFPTLALVLGWQLWYLQRDVPDEETVGRHRMSLLALSGLITAAIAVALYGVALPPEVREAVTGIMGWPYVFLAGCGWGVQFASWLQIRRSPRLEKIWLATASAGLLMTLVGVAMIREIIRWFRLDGNALFPLHEQSAGVGGLPLFLVFFVVNAALVAYCIIRVRRGLAAGASAS